MSFCWVLGSWEADCICFIVAPEIIEMTGQQSSACDIWYGRVQPPPAVEQEASARERTHLFARAPVATPARPRSRGWPPLKQSGCVGYPESVACVHHFTGPGGAVPTSALLALRVLAEPRQRAMHSSPSARSLPCEFHPAKHSAAIPPNPSPKKTPRPPTRLRATAFRPNAVHLTKRNRLVAPFLAMCPRPKCELGKALGLPNRV